MNKIIYKLIITNFIRNAKYIDLIEQLLNDNDIELRKINDYSDKEINKIVKLISNISFCEKAQGKSDCLFVNIDESFNNQIEPIKEKNDNYSNKEYIKTSKKNYIQYFTNNYIFLIDNYNKKKDYLKYFIEEL